MKQRKKRIKLANRLQHSMYAYGGSIGANNRREDLVDNFDYEMNTAKGIGIGAATGAATGATIGSIVPGYGTVVGAAVGAVGGGIVGGISADAENGANRSKFNNSVTQRMRRDEEIKNTVLGDFPTQGFEGGTFNARFGGKLPYAVGGVHTVNPVDRPKPKERKDYEFPKEAEDYKTVTVDMEEEYDLHPNSEKGMELGFKLAKEGLAKGITYRFKCSGGQQCAGQINTLEQNIGKRLQSEINVLKQQLGDATPEWAKAGDDYLKLVNEEIPNLGKYIYQDAWTPTNPKIAETVYTDKDYAKQYMNIPISERTTPLDYIQKGFPQELLEEGMGATRVDSDRKDNKKSPIYAAKRSGKNKEGNKGNEHVIFTDPKGAITNPITGKKGTIIKSGFATKGEGGNNSGQAFSVYDWVSPTDGIGHFQGENKYTASAGTQNISHKAARGLKKRLAEEVNRQGIFNKEVNYPDIISPAIESTRVQQRVQTPLNAETEYNPLSQANIQLAQGGTLKTNNMTKRKGDPPKNLGQYNVRYHKRDKAFLERQMKKAKRRDQRKSGEERERQLALERGFVQPGSQTLYSQNLYDNTIYEGKTQTTADQYRDVPFFSTGDSNNQNIYSQIRNQQGIPNFMVNEGEEGMQGNVDFARLTPTQKREARQATRSNNYAYGGSIYAKGGNIDTDPPKTDPPKKYVDEDYTMMLNSSVLTGTSSRDKRSYNQSMKTAMNMVNATPDRVITLNGTPAQQQQFTNDLINAGVDSKLIRNDLPSRVKNNSFGIQVGRIGGYESKVATPPPVVASPVIAPPVEVATPTSRTPTTRTEQKYTFTPGQYDKFKESGLSAEDYTKQRLQSNNAPNSKGFQGTKSSWANGGKMHYAGASSMYANGGQMPMPVEGAPQGQPQGGMETLASNVEEVQGPSHEQGGVPMGANAEVEGGEVTSQQPDGSTNVYSDRIEYKDGVTFAAKADQIGTEKGKYEEKLDSTSVFVKGTARRQIEKLDGELLKLFNAQEVKKRALGIPSPEEQAAMEQQAAQGQMGGQQMPQEGMPQQGMPQEQMMQEQMMQQQMGGGQGMPQQRAGQFAMGGKMKYEHGGPYHNADGTPSLEFKDGKLQGAWNKDYVSYPGEGSSLGGASKVKRERKEGKGMSLKTNQTVGAIANQVGNAANFALSFATPQTPLPVYNQAMPMKTDVNTSAQQANMYSQLADTNSLIKQNAASSQTVRGNMIANKAQNIGASNTMFENAANQRTQLDNANRANQQSIINSNVAKEEAYNASKLLRDSTIKSETSKNVSNTMGNFSQSLQEANQINKDYAEVEILKQQYKDSGVWNRKIEGIFKAMQSGSITQYQKSQYQEQLRLAKIEAQTGINNNDTGIAD